MPGAKNARGWQNLFLTLQYQVLVSAEHEAMISVGVIREFARTGSAALDNDDVGTTTPTIYWGKGLGDLPIGWFRPLALTGTFGFEYSDKRLTPLMELAWSSLASRPHSVGTQYLFGIGAIYTADTYAGGGPRSTGAGKRADRTCNRRYCAAPLVFRRSFSNTLGRPLLLW